MAKYCNVCQYRASLWVSTVFVFFAIFSQIFVFSDWNGWNVYFTVIPQARVGYEMIDSQRGAWRRVGYNHLISNKRESRRSVNPILTHRNLVKCQNSEITDIFCSVYEFWQFYIWVFNLIMQILVNFQIFASILRSSFFPQWSSRLRFLRKYP